MGADKIKDIKTWPKLKSVQDIQVFIDNPSRASTR